jgi:hypothetical protein
MIVVHVHMSRAALWLLAEMLVVCLLCSACWTSTSFAVRATMSTCNLLPCHAACTVEHSSTVMSMIRTASAGRRTPSVACVVQPGSSGFQKVFFGNEEIAIPVASRLVA